MHTVISESSTPDAAYAHITTILNVHITIKIHATENNKK